MNDIKIFRYELKGRLSRAEKVLADKAYQGDARTITPKDFDYYKYSKSSRKAMNKARSRHETINSRLKKFKALCVPFRQQRSKHHIVFRAAAAITQIDMENGNPPFQVTTYEDSALL